MRSPYVMTPMVCNTSKTRILACQSAGQHGRSCRCCFQGSRLLGRVLPRFLLPQAGTASADLAAGAAAARARIKSGNHAIFPKPRIRSFR